jgi:hypothetical protein
MGMFQDFVSCVHRFDFDLGGEEGGMTVVGGHIVACNTISKLSPAVTRRENPRTDLDESKFDALAVTSYGAYL